MTEPTPTRIWSRGFWIQALERAFKTAIQTPLSVWLGGDVAMDAFQMDWKYVLGLAVTGFLISIATSVVSTPVGPPNSPSTV